MTTAEVISLATNAGFTVDAQSEINASPKDTKNYPQGVWNLPRRSEVASKTGPGTWPSVNRTT